MDNNSARSSRLVWLLAGCCFVLGSSQQYILGVPDQIAADSGVTLSAISLLMTAFGVVNAVCAPILLIGTAHYSQRRQLVISLAIMAAGLALMGFSNSFPLLLVARGVMGVGNGAFVATAYAVAQRVAAPGKQASAMANVALGFSAASVLAMPTARALRDVVNWHWAYLLLSALAVVGILVIARVFPDTKGQGSSLTLKQRMSPLANRAVTFALFGTFFTFTSFSSFYTYVTPYIDAVLPDLGSATSVVLFVLGIMSLVGTKLCGAVADSFGSRRAIELGFAMQVFGLIVLFAVQSFGGVLIPFLMVWMCGAWMFVPVQNVILARLAGEGSGMAISLSNSFLQFGNAFGAAVAGGAIAVAPVTMLPLIAMPIALLAFGSESLAFRFGKITRRKPTGSKAQ